MKYVDAAGNDLGIGDWIAYGVRVGNSGDLHFGQVVELSSRKDWDGKKEPALKVHSLTYDWNKKELTPAKRISTLWIFDRIVKIPPYETLVRAAQK